MVTITGDELKKIYVENRKVIIYLRNDWQKNTFVFGDKKGELGWNLSRYVRKELARKNISLYNKKIENFL